MEASWLQRENKGGVLGHKRAGGGQNRPQATLALPAGGGRRTGPRPGTPPWGASGSKTPSCPSPAPCEVRTVRLGLGLAGRFLPHRESDDNFRPSPNFLHALAIRTHSPVFPGCRSHSSFICMLLFLKSTRRLPWIYTSRTGFKDYIYLLLGDTCQVH